MKAEDSTVHHLTDSESPLPGASPPEPTGAVQTTPKNNFLSRMSSAFLGYVLCSNAKYKTDDINYTNDEEKRFLLERKLDYISTLATVSMTWWVSSLVFCGSIFAAVWNQRPNLIDYQIICPLAAFISLFLLGLVLFGAQISWCYLPRLSRELSTLTQTAHDEKNILSSELAIFRWLMSVGTMSFILILLGWLLFWMTLPCQLY